jgi:hypothetical protein
MGSQGVMQVTTGCFTAACDSLLGTVCERVCFLGDAEGAEELDDWPRMWASVGFNPHARPACAFHVCFQFFVQDGQVQAPYRTSISDQIQHCAWWLAQKILLDFSTACIDVCCNVCCVFRCSMSGSKEHFEHG